MAYGDNSGEEIDDNDEHDDIRATDTDEDSDFEDLRCAPNL